MAFVTTIADGSFARRRIGRSDRVALVLAALALASGAAAWIADSESTTALATAALPRDSERLSFDDRFVPISTPESSVDNPALQPLDRSALTALEMKLRDAKGLLAQQLLYRDWRTAFSDPPKDPPKSTTPTDTVPLPRSRPVTADLELRSAATVATASPSDDVAPARDNRSLLQKLSDLLPGPVKLASLTPEDGIFRQAPDLTALGYDKNTAVYDISAHAVYLPSGLSLEAHSGIGSLRDDPAHVHQRMVGATPPATYDLKLREQLFHGVQAIRMLPANGSDTLGRSGLLAHSYMLGPNGDSNGCVSIKNYDRFLKAFNDGEINRLVVVPSMRNTTSAAQRATS
jgi:type VI secretion system (T6SS) effector TldE1-like protein